MVLLMQVRGAQLPRPKVAEVVKWSCTTLRAGTRAYLRALEALGF